MDQNGDGLPQLPPPDHSRYFTELLQEMRQLNRLRASQPDSYAHAASLLTAEITRVWNQIYRGDYEERGDEEDEQIGAGELVRLQEKILFPTGLPDKKCNLVGRILGPQGLSVKQLEAETDCSIVIRGDGSVKCPLKQDRLRGQPGWEHLEEPLHVLITAAATSRRSCENKLLTAVKIVSKLLKPGDDEYKKKQLVQLAIIRGTYRPDHKSYDKL